MRKRALLFLGLCMLTGCNGSSLPDEITATSSSGSLPHPSSTTLSPAGPIRGALPDGTIYDIAFPTTRAEEIAQIHAELVLEFQGNDVPLSTTIRRDQRAEGDNVFQSGDWTVEIDVPDDLGPQARDVVEEAIDVSTEVEMPVLTLRPPIRWSEPPQVMYHTFAVRSGCPEEATACNPTHAVSVIPHPGVTLDTPISVQSYALRPRSDSNYLPPGPLDARWSPDVLWTGEEMIVWGGSANGGQPTFIDGAAYSPAGKDWRRLPPPPLSREQATRALWTGTEMVVVGEEATAAWEPDRNEWRVVADGIVPPLDPGMTVTTGSEIFTWTTEELYRLDADEEWEVVPDPGVGDPDLLDGAVLRVIGTRVFAVGHDGCGRLVAQWGGDVWSEPVRIPLGRSEPVCGQPNQTAVVDDTLVMWDDSSAEVVSYSPASGAIMALPSFPLPALEPASGPLHVDGGFLVTAGLDAAILDTGAMKWRTAELPGLGSDVEMVWTGDEVLMWAKCCYGPDDVDAWRWAPPAR